MVSHESKRLITDWIWHIGLVDLKTASTHQKTDEPLEAPKRVHLITHHVQNRRKQVGHPLHVAQVKVVHDISHQNVAEHLNVLVVVSLVERVGPVCAVDVLLHQGLAVPVAREPRLLVVGYALPLKLHPVVVVEVLLFSLPYLVERHVPVDDAEEVLPHVLSQAWFDALKRHTSFSKKKLPNNRQEANVRCVFIERTQIKNGNTILLLNEFC